MRVEFREVSKGYYGHKALDGLTLTVPSGAVYGLVGSIYPEWWSTAGSTCEK